MRRKFALSALIIGTILLLIGCRTSESITTEPVSAPLLEEAAVEAAAENIEFTSVYDDPLYNRYLEAAEAAYANPSYFARPTASGNFVVENESAYISAEFSQHDMTIDAMLGEASFDLTGFGRGERVRAVRNVQPTASGPRVEYQYRNGIVGWYINSTEGLQQGWTIPEAPAGAEGDLILELGYEDGLTPQLRDEGHGLEFMRGRFGLVQYEGLLAFDAEGNKLHSVFEISEQGNVLLKVDDRGATYPITVDPLFTSSEFYTLQPGDFADTTATNFGYSVDIDWPYLIVGAPQDIVDAETVNEGGAWYVYRFDDDSDPDTGGNQDLATCDLLINGTNTATPDGICDWDWYTEDSVSDPTAAIVTIDNDTGSNDRPFQLGYDVAITAIGFTPSLVVGAPGNYVGEALVYARNQTDGSWDLIDNSAWNEYRGYCVDIDGNFAVFCETDSIFTAERNANTGNWGSFNTQTHSLGSNNYVGDLALCGDSCPDGEEYVAFSGGHFLNNNDLLLLQELDGSWQIRTPAASFLDNANNSLIGKSVDVFEQTVIVGIPDAQTPTESSAALYAYTDASNNLSYNVSLGLLKPFNTDSNAGQAVAVGAGFLYAVYGDRNTSGNGFVQIYDNTVTPNTADLLVDNLAGSADDVPFLAGNPPDVETTYSNIGNVAIDDGVVLVGDHAGNSNSGEVYAFHAANDLSVSVSSTASDGLVSEGGAIDYTITVINNGDFTDHNIEIDLDFLGARYPNSSTTTDNSSLTDSNGDNTFFFAETEAVEGVELITGGKWVINSLDPGSLLTLTISTTLSEYETCNDSSPPGGTPLILCNTDNDNQYASGTDGTYEDESVLQAEIKDHYLRNDNIGNNVEFARVGLAAPQLDIEIGYSETEPTLNEEITVVVTVTNNGNLDLGSNETVTLEVDLDTLLGAGVLALAEDTDDGASPEGDPIVYYKDTTDENYGTFVASGQDSIWTIPGPLLIDQSVTLVIKTVVIGQGVSFIQIENENRTGTGYVDETNTPFPFPSTAGDSGDSSALDANQVCDQAERIATSAGDDSFGECDDLVVNEITVNLVDVTVDVEDDVDPIGFAIENIPGPFVTYTVTVGNRSANFDADELVLSGVVANGQVTDFAYASTGSNDLDDPPDGLIDEAPNPFDGKCNESGGQFTCRLIEGELIPAGQAYEIYITVQPTTTTEQGSSTISFTATATLEAAIDEVESNNSETEITAVGNSVGEDLFEQNDSFDTLGTVGIITEELDDELDLTHFPNWNVLEQGLGAESDTFYFAERDVFRAEGSGLFTFDFEPLTAQNYHVFVALEPDVSTNVTRNECGDDDAVGGTGANADTDYDGDGVVECGSTVIEYGVPTTSFETSTSGTVSTVEFFGNTRQTATVDLGTQVTDFYVVVEPCVGLQPTTATDYPDATGGFYIFVAGRNSGSAADCGGAGYKTNEPGSYNLKVSSANTATNSLVGDAFEENDVVNAVTDEAKDISNSVNANTPTTIQNLTILPANDPDWFFFQGEKEAEFEALVTSLGTSGTDITIYDPSVELQGIVATTRRCLVYDDSETANDLCLPSTNTDNLYECESVDDTAYYAASGSTAPADNSDDGVCKLINNSSDLEGPGTLIGSGSGGVASTLTGTLERDAIFYVEVVPLILTELFGYELLITTNNSVSRDPYEDNDSQAISTAFDDRIALDTLITDATIAPTDDVDWFNYVNLNGIPFELQLQAIGNITGLNVNMYNSSGTKVAATVTNNGSKNPVLSYTPTEADVFFFEVIATDELYTCTDSAPDPDVVTYEKTDITSGSITCVAPAENSERFQYTLKMVTEFDENTGASDNPDEYEENDTIAQATNLSSRGLLNTQLTDVTQNPEADDDYWYFITDELISVEVTSLGSGLDLGLFTGSGGTTSIVPTTAADGDICKVVNDTTQATTYVVDTGGSCTPVAGSTVTDVGGLTNQGVGLNTTTLTFSPENISQQFWLQVTPDSVDSTDGLDDVFPYYLTVNLGAAATSSSGVAGDSFEDNDTAAQAADIANSLNKTFDASIFPAGDADYYTFTSESDDMELNIVNFGPEDVIVTVFTPNPSGGFEEGTFCDGASRASLTDATGDSSNAGADCSIRTNSDTTMLATPSGAGTYIVEVLPVGNAVTYNYKLQVIDDREAVVVSQSDLEDPFENNDTAAQARSNSAANVTGEFGSTITTANIEPVNDEDWYLIRFEGSLVTSANALDDNYLALELYETDGSTFAYGSHGGTSALTPADQQTTNAACESSGNYSKNPSLTSPTDDLFPLGNYYLRVIPCKANATTDYFLTLNFDADGDGSVDGSGGSSSSGIITDDEYEDNEGFNDIDGGILGANDLNVENRVTLYESNPNGLSDPPDDIDIYPFFGEGDISATVDSLSSQQLTAGLYDSSGSLISSTVVTGGAGPNTGQATGTNLTLALSGAAESLYFLRVECGESDCPDSGFFYDFFIDDGGLSVVETPETPTSTTEDDETTDEDDEDDETTDEDDEETTTEEDPDDPSTLDTDGDGIPDSEELEDEVSGATCDQNVDLAERNNRFDQAFRIAAGNTIDLNFDPGCLDGPDIDYFAMTIKTDIVYTCETSNLGTGVDTNMVLYGPSADTSNQIVSNDDINTQNGEINSRVTFTAGYSGTAYILVQQNGVLSSVEDSDYTLSCFTGTASGTDTTGTGSTDSTGTGTDADGEGGIDDIIVQLLRVPTAVPELSTEETGVVDVSVLVGVDNNVNDLIDLTEGVNLVSVRALNPTNNTLVASGVTDPQGNVRMLATVEEDGEVLIVIPLLSVGRAFRPDDEQQDYVLTLVAGTTPGIIP